MSGRGELGLACHVDWARVGVGLEVEEGTRRGHSGVEAWSRGEGGTGERRRRLRGAGRGRGERGRGKLGRRRRGAAQGKREEAGRAGGRCGRRGGKGEGRHVYRFKGLNIFQMVLGSNLNGI